MKENMSYAKMDSCIIELTTIVEEIKNIIEQVKQVSNVINQKTLWQGKAANYYAQRLNNFVNSIQVVEPEFRKCITVLQKSKANYQQLEQKIISNVDEDFYLE